MPNYNQAHQFYAGVDLHARSMFVHVVNAKGRPPGRPPETTRSNSNESNIDWCNGCTNVAALLAPRPHDC